VLCFHLELLYEAKVLDSKPKDPNDKGDGYVYKIHYKGWKNTYVSLFFVLFEFVLFDLAGNEPGAMATTIAMSIGRRGCGVMMILPASHLPRFYAF